MQESAANPPSQGARAPAATPSNEPMQRDLRFLKFELSRVLRRHASDPLLELMSDCEALGRQQRDGDKQALEALSEKIASLSLESLCELIRALMCQFDLTNLSEDRHRVRVLRDRERAMHPRPQAESIGDAIASLAQAGMSAQAMQKLLDQLTIELVFTAHPTEARRRTSRNILRRLRHDMNQLDDPRQVPRERTEMLGRIVSDLDCLWETDPLRPTRPSVIGEVQRSVFVLDSLWEVLPSLMRIVRNSLKETYPEQRFHIPAFLRFGTWIGGDRDGNPFVTTAVTRQTMTMLREAAIERHMAQCQHVSRVLSLSETLHPVIEPLARAMQEALQQWPCLQEVIKRHHPSEKYRQWLDVVAFRLQQTLATPLGAPLAEGAYCCANDMQKDVQLVADSLITNGQMRMGRGRVQDWLDRIAVFGFYFARMDIREESTVLNQAVDELMRAMGIADNYLQLPEEDRLAALARPMAQRQTRCQSTHQLSPQTQETLKLFDMLEELGTTHGGDGLGTLIVSMTHAPSDALAMWWLCRVAASRRGWGTLQHPLPVAPLFETISDLRNAPAMLERMLSEPSYRDHVRQTGNIQTCMIGYSDSTKDGGFLTSNWELYRTQARLAEVTHRHDTALMVFHGRGGSLGRGGGPAARGIMALPSRSVAGRLRTTEQGEVLAERYDNTDVALRHLEQVTYATMRVSSLPQGDIDPAWITLIEKASEHAYRHYRMMVETPGFVDYFGYATPVDIIESLPIGSRPARRRGERKLENLRAIPYTFAWLQSRHHLTAFYGMGTGLQTVNADDFVTLRDMYKHWPFFHAVIHNAELALIKADMFVARQYSQLVPDQSLAQSIYQQISQEYQRTRTMVLGIIGREELLDGATWLRQSVNLRNPLLDVLNLIQIELMRRKRQLPVVEETREDPQIPGQLDQALRLSVQALATGLRTTG